MNQLINIPVTIVTGFLGAGKTTLMNTILNDWDKEKIAVLMNEFGHISIDDKLLDETKFETIYTMKNGCICCVTQNELEDVLADFMMRYLDGTLHFERLIIELSGFAHPLQVIHTFFNDPLIKETYHLDCVVAVVDALHFQKHLQFEENQVQLGCADLILINKVDLVSKEELEKIRTKLRSINAFAELKETSYSKLQLSSLFNRYTFDVHSNMELKYETSLHIHNTDIHSIVIEEESPLDIRKVNHFLNDELHMLGDDLLRYKGILSIYGKNKRVVLQGLYHLFSSEVGKDWADGEKRISQVVLIGKNLNQKDLQRLFSKCVVDDYIV